MPDVADLHKDARECFVMWCNNGKPRQGWLFDLMRQTRSQFKYALRTVKNNENVLCRESLANKLACSNPNKFWQEIRTMTSRSTSLPSSIEGVSGKHAIYLSYGRVILGDFSMLYWMMGYVIFLVTLGIRMIYM